MSSYNIQPNESRDEYISRLIQNRREYNLMWKEVRDLVKNQTGQSINVSTLHRRKEKLLQQDLQEPALVEIDEEEVGDAIDALQHYMLQGKKLKYQLTEERNQNAAFVRQLAREDSIKEIAKEAAKVISKTTPLCKDFEVCSRDNSYEAILMLSDWHYGIEIDNSLNKYNTSICKERLNTLYSEVVKRCKQNNVKKLHVVNLSDLISGRIHLQLRLQTRIDVITQIMEVSEILATFLTSLSLKFEIDYYDCLDNHSRIEPSKNDSLDLESLCRITPWFIKERLSDNKRVNVIDNSFSEDIITFTVKHFRIAGVHGDRDLVSNATQSLSMFTNEFFDLVLLAHFHHFAGDEQSETIVLSNGSLMGIDDYAFKKRLRSKPSQTLIFVSDSNVIDSIHRIIL